MENGVAVINGSAVTKVAALSDETMHALVIHGDLSKLSQVQKVEYYRAFCARVGLDPATQPFKLLKLNGKEILYCDRGGTAQLNKKHEVSHKITERRREDDLYIVSAQASTKDGRCTESIGAVSISGLKGESLANAIMKAETKSKRRATLDLLGLGMLDESEVDSIPGAQPQSAPESVQVYETISALPLRPSAPKDVPEEAMKGWRKWRAWFNQRALKAQTGADLDKVCEEFEGKHAAVKDIWSTWTFHDDFETFASLNSQHRERVERNDWEKTPAGLAEWRADLAKVKDEAGFRRFEDQYTKRDYLQTADNLDALNEKATELSIPEYADHEEDEGPTADSDSRFGSKG
jgi:hypothetical protein